MKLLRIAVFLFLICIVFVYFQFRKLTEDQGPLVDSLVLEIPKGASSQKVADILYNHRVIGNSLVFYHLVKLLYLLDPNKPNLRTHQTSFLVYRTSFSNLILIVLLYLIDSHIQTLVSLI